MGQWLPGDVFLQIKGRVWDVFNDESHLAQAPHDKIALVLVVARIVSLLSFSTWEAEGAVEKMTYTEVALEMDHLVLHEFGVEHGYGGLLEGVVGTAVKIAAA